MRFFIKAHILLAICILTFQIVKGQNYQMVSSNSTSHFSYGGDAYIHSIKIDSSSVSGSDTILYNFRVISDNYSTENECIDLKDTSWAGQKIIIRPDGYNIFFNKNSDSIKVNTTAILNETWILYKFSNGDYIEASIANITFENLFGFNDSVKTILLQVKNSLAVNVNHVISGKEIKISKMLGVQLFYDVFDFPANINAYTLIGISKVSTGFLNITAKEVFDFDVGDEFHFSYVLSYLSTFYINEQTKMNILSKSISLNGDTVNYNYAYLEVRNYVDYQNSTTTNTITQDTLSLQIILTQSSYLDKLTYEVVGSTDVTKLFKNNSYNSRTQKIIESKYIYFDGSCYRYIHTDPCDNYSLYIEGIGGPFWDKDGCSFSNSDHYYPVYFKKGTEDWGTPIDFDSLTSIQIKESNKLSVSVFPVPFQDILIIEYGISGTITYRLYNLLGENLSAGIFTNGRIVINTAEVPSGFYFVEVRNIEGQKSTRKILKM